VQTTGSAGGTDLYDFMPGRIEPALLAVADFTAQCRQPRSKAVSFNPCGVPCLFNVKALLNRTQFFILLHSIGRSYVTARRMEGNKAAGPFQQAASIPYSFTQHRPNAARQSVYCGDCLNEWLPRLPRLPLRVEAPNISRFGWVGKVEA